MSRKKDIETMIDMISEIAPIPEEQNLGSIEDFPILLKADEWFIDELNEEISHLGVQIEVCIDQVILKVY